MSKLNEREIGFLKLILRSPDIGDGWKKVSGLVWQLAANFGPKELIEIDAAQLRVRLSEEGRTVVKWLL